MTVYKYEVPILDVFTLELPVRAQILSFQVQHGTPTIWALVNPEAETISRKFILIGTGHEISNHYTLKFIGTIQLFNGDLIYHLFEVTHG